MIKDSAIFCVTISIFFGGSIYSQPRSIGRGYSQKLLNQDKYFDSLNSIKNETKNLQLTNKILQTSNNNLLTRSIEIDGEKISKIVVENDNRLVEIKASNEPNIKLVVNFHNNEFLNLSNEVLLEKVNLKYKVNNNSLQIIAGYDNYQLSKKTITIYIPYNKKTVVDSKYSDVFIYNNFKDLSVDITNGNLEIDTAVNLTVNSKYANISINKIKNGQIDFINGSLNIQKIESLNLVSKYSNVEIEDVGEVVMNSTNDEYEIGNVAEIRGQKNYGKLRIDDLKNAIELEGTNADIAIKKISANLKIIKINNQFAQLKLPLKMVNNFSFSFIGEYSTIYKNFLLRLNNTSLKQQNVIEGNESKITTENIEISSLKTNVGNGKDASVDINCNHCTIDLK